MLLPALTVAASEPALVEQSSGVRERLQAISAASELVVWASGLGSRWLRTEDGGATWTAGTIAAETELELRDVVALSAETAWILAAGPGERSRIYRTDDGGTTWDEQFRNLDPAAFYDCLAFWDEKSGLAFSDSVDGRFGLQLTNDGGSSWTASDALPDASGREGGLAASGTCVLTLGGKGAAGSLAWIATAAGEQPRVLRTADRGLTWTSSTVPVLGGTPTSGLATLAFWNAREGIAAGGDIALPDERADVVARTTDGGRSWTKAARPPFPGPVYGSAVVPSPGERQVVIVGPRGVALSTDSAASFTLLTSTEHWAVAFASARAGWMVGPEGRITALRFDE